MFEVVITEVSAHSESNPQSPAPMRVERYRQTVDVLDIRAVMAAVNHKPRKPRTPKAEK